MEQMTFDSLVEAYDQAESNVIPFLVAGDDLAVVGDANETQKNIHDFKITFRVPHEGKYVHKTVEYKDVFITPRMDAKIVKSLTALVPYFRKVNAQGGIEKLSDEEKIVVYNDLGDDFYDALYDVVAVVLKIDPDLKEYMTIESVTESALQIFRAFPETLNETDTFFGKSSAMQ